ncbi:MAG: Methylcrotonyl-CoA carboxylase carboxyl transferase subunit (EC [uncultured Paraburkholderia sp.]|nr:MAG: Methylcrotonyl-CoA carboxylase carboxyl transferase subunit (EC [uncultured Paraburkholderia sp.]CAH2924709.1 MAG: Methylcrotonyl-CoA carboxylase carboxyl transferase subunit (EC [uncultured Paraburkholderia sp.]
MIDPEQTRDVLGLGLSAAMNAPADRRHAFRRVQNVMARPVRNAFNLFDSQELQTCNTAR